MTRRGGRKNLGEGGSGEKRKKRNDAERQKMRHSRERHQERGCRYNAISRERERAAANVPLVGHEFV